MYGSSRRSRILTAGDRRKMRRYEEPWLPGLPGFIIGIIIEFFHIDGMEVVKIEILKMWVRDWRPRGPRCLR
jgi:hypothetical protein